MKLALTAFTRRGMELAEELADRLNGQGYQCRLSLPERLALSEGREGYSSLSAWTGERFADAQGLIFVGACGIAVRAIAPYLKDKLTDPAVVSVDEGGHFTVPLVSGHVGGANDLARQVAFLTGGTAVISTATDVNGRFAVDQWAARQGMTISDRVLAKRISSALLAGQPVGFYSSFPVEGTLPEGISEGTPDLGFAVALDQSVSPFRQTLWLCPKLLRLGIGCRRGVGEDVIAAAVDRVLTEAGLPAEGVKEVATIDRKADEAGLLAFCQTRGLPLSAYSAEELRAVPGTFTASSFVAGTVGIENVCERAAVLAGGTLVVPKQAGGGVTVAVACLPYTVRFDGQERMNGYEADGYRIGAGRGSRPDRPGQVGPGGV